MKSKIFKVGQIVEIKSIYKKGSWELVKIHSVFTKNRTIFYTYEYEDGSGDGEASKKYFREIIKPKKSEIWWTVTSPYSGFCRCFSTTKKKALETCSENMYLPWALLKRKGFRAVRVKVSEVGK
jgi:hypothetical protein